MFPVIIDHLRDDVLGPASFFRVEAKLRPTEDKAGMIAEDDDGRSHDCGAGDFSNIEPAVTAEDWLQRTCHDMSRLNAGPRVS
jgi:hypothetical protein